MRIVIASLALALLFATSAVVSFAQVEDSLSDYGNI